MYGDAAHHDPIPAMIREPVTQDGGRVDVVTVEQALLPEFRHALSGFAHVRDAAGSQQIVDGPLERDRIEITGARNAQIGGQGRRMIVISTIGHGFFLSALSGSLAGTQAAPMGS
jgi:hypothetical protein